MLPAWATNLAHLYWRLRAARSCSRPGPRTWRRRIAVEKKRLLDAGVPGIEVHLVCRVLVDPSNPRAEARWMAYLEARQRGVSPWS